MELQEKLWNLQTPNFWSKTGVWRFQSFSRINIHRAKGHDKNVPNLEVEGAAPASPTPPVFRVVL